MNNTRIEYITLKAIQADSSNLSKTKWNKIIFFTDLAFYTCDEKKYSGKIYTGLNYIKMPYGPVVDNYNTIISNVVAKNDLQVKSYIGLYSNFSQYIEPINKNITIKSTICDLEDKVITNVIKKFIHLTANKLSEYSHCLTVWKVPNMYEELNFEYANHDKFKIKDDYIGSFYQMVMH